MNDRFDVKGLIFENGIRDKTGQKKHRNKTKRIKRYRPDFRYKIHKSSNRKKQTDDDNKELRDF